jgi:uncharacterized membrane protein YdjX (TVP38/TMEM64 family)
MTMKFSDQRLRQLLVLVCLVLLGCSCFPVDAQASVVNNVANFHPQMFLKNTLEWIAGLGAIGPLVFIGIYTMATIAFWPGSILTLGAGIVFGVGLGTVYVFIGAMIGAIAAFLVGRYLARTWVARKLAGNDKFRAIDQAVGRDGLKIVLLTRLSPIFPFNFLNYAFGLTGVSFPDYVLGSLGILPGTMMYVYLGSLAGNLALIGTATQPTNANLQWALRIIGLLATVAVTVYVTRLAKQALEQEGLI